MVAAALTSADAATTLASEETAPKVAAFLYLEEVIALQRCSRQHARRFGAPGAALRSRVQPRSRAAFWAEACRVEADKKRALSRRTATNGGFFERDGWLLEDAQINRIEDIPCVIVQGRYDVVCPATSAWELHRKLPGSTLHITTTGHSAFEPEIVERLVEATDGFRGLS